MPMRLSLKANLRFCVSSNVFSGGEVDSWGKRGVNQWKSIPAPWGIDPVAELRGQHFLSRKRSFHPIYDRDVNGSIARPNLGAHGVGDHSTVVDDIVKATFAGVVLPNCVGADKARAPARRKLIVRAPKPIHAVVCPTGYFRVTLPQLVQVDPSKFLLHLILALEGRIADDTIGRWPVTEQGVVALEIIVKIVQGQGWLFCPREIRL